MGFWAGADLWDIIASMSSMESGSSFDSLHFDLAQQRLTPIDLPVPEDPYSWRRQQFNALRGLEYPVDLWKVSGAYAREAYADYTDPETLQQGIPDMWRPWYEQRFNTYRDWRLPVVHSPKFIDWIRVGIGVNTENMKLTDEQRTDLHWHPATVLPGAIDLGLFKVIREYKDQIDDHSPYMSDGMPWGAHRKFVGDCYISAFDRFVEMIKVVPSLREVEGMQVTRADVALRRNYSNSGLEGATTHELTALIRDFYIMLGAAVPQFAKFSSAH
jgi:hypothetical protein